MATIGLPADAEQVVLTYLRAALAARDEPYAAGVAVGTKVAPGTSPGRYVRIRRVGGVPYSVVQDNPRIDVQVWYATGQPTDEQNRQRLALLVWALLRALPGQTIWADGVPVTCYRPPGGTDFLGPTALPDPADNSKTITGLTVEIGMRIRAA